MSSIGRFDTPMVVYFHVCPCLLLKEEVDSSTTLETVGIVAVDFCILFLFASCTCLVWVPLLPSLVIATCNFLMSSNRVKFLKLSFDPRDLCKYGDLLFLSMNVAILPFGSLFSATGSFLNTYKDNSILMVSTSIHKEQVYSPTMMGKVIVAAFFFHTLSCKYDNW